MAISSKTFITAGTGTGTSTDSVFTIADNDAMVYGATLGNETVRITSGVTGVSLDANIERVELSSTLAAYKFVVVAGTGLQIQNASGGVVATIPNINQNVKIAFTDGSATLVQSGATAFTLNTVALTAGATDAATTPTLSGGTALTSSDFSSLLATSPITVSNSGTVAATVLSTANGTTSGLVTAASVTTLTGTALEIKAVTDALGTSGDRISVGIMTGDVSNVAVTLTGTTATAADLKAIETATSGWVDAGTVTTVTAASVADAKLLFVTDQHDTTGDKINMAAAATVALSDASAAAADLAAIGGATTGTVTGASIAAISSSTVADTLAALVTSATKVTVAANATVALSDASAAAADLAAIGGATTGTVTGASIAAISSSTVADTLAALVTSATKVTVAANATVALSDASATAADLKAIDAATTGAVDASLVSAITGTAAAIASVNAAAGITKPAGFIAKPTAGSADIADLNAIDLNNSTAVDASLITSVTDTTNVDTIDLTAADITWGTTISVTGGTGADAITLRASDVAKETIVFSDTATNNGADTIASFTAGATKDALNFEAFLTTESTTFALGVILTTVNAFNNKVSTIVKANITDTANGVLDAADFAVSEKAFAAVGDGEKGVVMVEDSAGGAKIYYVYDSDATGGVTAAVTLVGTLTSVTTGFHSDNFIVA